MNWKDLMQRRPETLSIMEWHALLTKFETLEEQKRQAYRQRLPYNALVTDAVGFEHEFDLGRVGDRADKPPRSFRLPVRPGYRVFAFQSTDEISMDVRAKDREFRLVGFRGWDRMPLYEEVVG